MYNSIDFYGDMSVVEKSNNIEVEILNRTGHLLYDSAASRVMQGWEEGKDFSVFDVLRTRNLKITSHKVLQNGNSLDRLVDTDTGLQYMRYSSIAENGNIIKLYAQMNYLANASNATTKYVSFIAIATFALIMLSLYFYLFHFTRPLVEMNKITRATTKSVSLVRASTFSPRRLTAHCVIFRKRTNSLRLILSTKDELKKCARSLCPTLHTSLKHP